MPDRIFFHIGLHKTATSWLQNHLFPNLDGVKVLRAQHFEEISRYIRDGGPETLLVSHEEMGGTIGRRREPGDSERRLKETLAAIAVAAPHAAIIIGFREHSAWLHSACSQRAKKHPTKLDSYAESFSADELSWCRILGLIEASCDAVFAFLYEELPHSPHALVDDLCRFLGVKPPSDLDDLLDVRENPSPRSLQGQLLSRSFYRLSRRLAKITNTKISDAPIAYRLRKYGFRLGAHFDRYFPAYHHVPFNADTARVLRQDWANLLSLVGERRGRDFSDLDAATSSSRSAIGIAERAGRGPLVPWRGFSSTVERRRSFLAATPHANEVTPDTCLGHAGSNSQSSKERPLGFHRG